MGSQKAPGWYPDPSGQPDRFRWWDGSRWTQSLSESLWSPEPRDPQPFVAQPPEPAPWQAQATRSTPRVVEIDEPEPGARRPLIVAGVVVAVVLVVGAVVGIASWLASRPAKPVAESGTTSADKTPSPRDSRSGSPGASTSPTPPPPASTDRTAPPGGAGTGHLRFTAAKTWRSVGDGILRKKIPYEQAAVIDTEMAFDGKRNWQASILTGQLPPELAVQDKGDLKARAMRAAGWYLKTEWNLPVDDPEYKKVEVAGRPAGLVSTGAKYQIKGLKSDHDDVDVMVVDMGGTRPAGLVIISIPENQAKLWQDVDQMMNSMRLAG